MELDDDGEVDDLGDDEGAGAETFVTVEVSGLSLYTHHGVSDAEREIGQRLVVDLRMDVGESDATLTDRVEDTVDYAEVCQVVALVAQQRSYRTLERLCAAIADRLLEQFGLESVWVKAAKPEPPIPLPVEEVSVEVWREREEGGDPAVGYLGLGSNLGDRRGHLQDAVDALPGARGRRARQLVGLRDRAGGGGARPARVPQRRRRGGTALDPEAVLEASKAIERDLGRKAGGRRHAPRPIDIDLLLFGDAPYASERLRLPHGEVTSRRFVLVPLLELDPDLRTPDGTSLRDALDALPESGWVRPHSGPLRT